MLDATVARNVGRELSREWSIQATQFFPSFAVEIQARLGIEKHDDLCDACVWFILGVTGDGIEEQKVHYI